MSRIKKSILIIDYGLGNLNSVSRGVAAAGGIPKISQNHKDLRDADKVILPGVGAFAAGMEGLKKGNFINTIKEYVAKDRELFGLCLGMQLLFEHSEEFGKHSGLGLVKGTIKPLSPKNKQIFKIPHIGWNSLLKYKVSKYTGTILEDVKDGDMVYFVHSFAAPVTSATLAQTEYGNQRFCSVVSYKNVSGTQFHPEKSGEVGQEILRQFIKK